MGKEASDPHSGKDQTIYAHQGGSEQRERIALCMKEAETKFQLAFRRCAPAENMGKEASDPHSGKEKISLLFVA